MVYEWVHGVDDISGACSTGMVLSEQVEAQVDLVFSSTLMVETALLILSGIFPCLVVRYWQKGKDVRCPN